ncbi:MAG: nidogen-like domain-containing protein [Acidobacteriota bacterium]
MPRTCRHAFALMTLTLTLAAPLAARTVLDHPWCGTRPSLFAAQAAIHNDHQRRQIESRSQTGSLVQTERVGDVAVLVDDGSFLVQPNPLDLGSFAIQYTPQKKGGYVASASSAVVEDNLGERISLSDDDSRQLKLPKKLRFRFFGKVQTRLFVHSDGNLTFSSADAASTARDLARLISGPPRIAPFFSDLDPESATGDGGVYVLISDKKVVVTWRDVPEFGGSNRNTFQTVLYSDGRITFAFGALQASEAVVGLAPGNGGSVQLIDYTAALPSSVFKSGLAERFATTRSFDHLAVARAFFREFADVYDHLIVFLDFPLSLEGAFAFESTVKNDVRGIGQPVFDNTAQAGSHGRLRSFVQMGTLSRYPDNPETELLGTNSTLDVLGQEAGHRWLSFLFFVDGNGAPSNSLLGRDESHWSFCHNSLASDMEGNEWQESAGNRFTSVGATSRYSPLDQYAMGLIGPGDVPPFYLVGDCVSPSAAPAVGAIIQGPRIDVTIDQILAAEGPRVPDFRKAPHAFDMAFILVGEAGRFPSDESIAKVDRIRAAWETYFAAVTDGNGAVRTELKTRH